MTRRLLMLALLVAAVAFALPASASFSGPMLTGEVGPGYEISFRDAGGNPVTQLPAGDYTLEIKDRSAIHNFHLVGAGVDVSTGVSEVGETTWNLHLPAGSYQFYCDTHYEQMTGSFTVSSDGSAPPAASPPPAPSPPPASPPPAPAPAPSPASPSAAATALVGTVGPGFTITLTDQAGAALTNLDPGSYTIQVHDKANIHNFHLLGPGVDKSTEVDFVGDASWDVTLSNGTYTFQCDPHADRMRGSFTVGGAATPPPAPPPPPAVSPPPSKSAKLPKLTGVVGPGYTIALGKAAGRRVKTVKAAAYLLTVRDRAAIHDFHLVGPGIDKKTGVTFRGTVLWKVKLRKGATYRYWCDPHSSTMKGSFRAT